MYAVIGDISVSSSLSVLKVNKLRIRNTDVDSTHSASITIYFHNYTSYISLNTLVTNLAKAPEPAKPLFAGWAHVLTSNRSLNVRVVLLLVSDEPVAFGWAETPLPSSNPMNPVGSKTGVATFDKCADTFGNFPDRNKSNLLECAGINR